jgi:hypothetical protein
MVQPKENRLKTAAILALGLVFLLTVVAYADDPAFAGKWKGESRPAATPAPGAPGAGVTGGAVAAPAGGTPGGGAPPAAAPGGGARGGGGGGRGGGGGFGGPQKVTLNLKQSKDNKLSGNITIASANADGEALDVKEGKVDGNTITFKAGRPEPLEYKGELKGEELTLTRTSTGGRGPTTTTFVLTKNK